MSLTIQDVINEHVRLNISLNQTWIVIHKLFNEATPDDIVKRYREAVSEQNSSNQTSDSDLAIAA